MKVKETLFQVGFFVLIGVVIPVATLVTLGNPSANAESHGHVPWVLEINGSDYESNEYPNINTKGDYLYISWIDVDGMKREAYTHGDIILLQNAEVDDAR